MPKLEKVYDAIEDIHGAPRPSIAVLDLESANAESFTTLAQSIASEFGRLDGLVHNASILGERYAIEQYDAMNGEPYNVGLSDANLTKLELCEEIKQRIPEFVVIEAPIGEDPDKRDYIVSNAKIEATGFQPDWSLGQGIDELIKGYRMLRNARYANV